MPTERPVGGRAWNRRHRRVTSGGINRVPRAGGRSRRGRDTRPTRSAWPTAGRRAESAVRRVRSVAATTRALPDSCFTTPSQPTRFGFTPIVRLLLHHRRRVIDRVGSCPRAAASRNASGSSASDGSASRSAVAASMSLYAASTVSSRLAGCCHGAVGHSRSPSHCDRRMPSHRAIRIYIIVWMKKTLHIDDALLHDAKSASGARTDTDAVRLGLEALVRHGAYQRLRALRGSEPRARVVHRRRERSSARH
jgi:Arc/MetJ family transcription regulator